MRILIIAIFLATTAFSFFLKYLTYSMRAAPLPENVRDVFDAEEYKKNQAYKMENLGFSIIAGLVGMGLTLAFLLLNLHNQLFVFISQHTANVHLSSLFIMLVPMIISMIIAQFMGIYANFVIEAKYGFNKYTPAKFFSDFIKQFVLIMLLLGGLLSLFLRLHSWLGDWVFLAFFFVLIAFQFFMSFISPLIIRLIYKLTPLEDGELKTKIEKLAKDTGYSLKGIYWVDASKRTTKMNAFASGYGKTRTIGLFDTMIGKLTDDEIIAVLAHEIGHIKHRHILKSMPLSFISLAIMAVAAYFIVAMPAVSQAFGFADANIAFGVYVLMIMLGPIELILSIPENAQSRKHEYEADAFELAYAGKEVSISAIKKLYHDGFGNLTPHPFVVMMEHSHPTLTQRVAAFEKD